jgi:hypothetical protein
MGNINCSNCACTNKEQELRTEFALNDEQVGLGSSHKENKTSSKKEDKVKRWDLAKKNIQSIIKIQSTWRGHIERK